MKDYIIKKSHFSNPEDAIKICSRMGWMPEQDSEDFMITVPAEDARLFEFIFDYFI